MEKKAIGIIGGMGPLATVDLFEKITRHTKAASDQEHIHVLIDSNTAIPDRTAALLHGGPDPVPELTKSAKRLEAMGAGVLIMPCNTAHGYYDAVAASVSVPVLHMVCIAAKVLAERGVKRAGLLATDGTVLTGIYQRCFQGTGVELLTPDPLGQAAMMEMIYQGVKAGDEGFDASRAREAMECLMERGAETLVLGCTEMPLAVRMYGIDLPVVDPTLELALEAIRFAGGTVI